MKILGYEIFKDKSEAIEVVSDKLSYSEFKGYRYTNVVPFDGEKTPYELGSPINYYLDYYTLRYRAWESYLKSDVVQNAIRKYCLWIVGSGLKLQSNPEKMVLDKYKVSINEGQIREYIDSVESLFRLYANSKNSTYSKETTLHDEAAEALKNAIICGDILCVTRFDGSNVTVETIDGGNLQTPIMGEEMAKAIKRGNTIVQGVEVNGKGSHVAYYVITKSMNYERIPAYNSLGMRTAWLMYGMKYKKSEIRGMSLLAAVIETADKMDRYKDATLGSAEENAKIPYTIEHDNNSTGENPLAQHIAQSFGKGKGTAPETETDNADVVASKVAQTTNKMALNMPKGASLKRNSGNTDLYFRDFFEINIDIIYATLGIPPEVAMDKFGGAYSGSRAAIKSWEYKMMTDRDIILKRQFYKPFFDFWLDIQILKNVVQAPGYLGGDEMVKESYRNCRFIGATVPHIDPVKEVLAERQKLGDRLKGIPLTSIEQSMENLNTGDYNQVIKQVTNEKNIAGDFAIAQPAIGSV